MKSGLVLLSDSGNNLSSYARPIYLTRLSRTNNEDRSKRNGKRMNRPHQTSIMSNEICRHAARWFISLRSPLVRGAAVAVSALCALTWLTGCNKSASQGETVFVMVPKGVHPYYEPCYEGFKDAAAKYGIKTEYRAAKAF